MSSIGPVGSATSMYSAGVQSAEPRPLPNEGAGVGNDAANAAAQELVGGVAMTMVQSIMAQNRRNFAMAKMQMDKLMQEFREDNEE